MRSRAVFAYVAVTALAACLALGGAAFNRPPFPGLWGMGSFVVIVFLLDVSATTLRGGDGKGSLSFVAELASGVLFGAFWGGLLTGASAFLAQTYSGRPTIRATFNAFQRALSVVLAIVTYKMLGGTTPPRFLGPGVVLIADQVAGGMVAFLAGSLIYILANSVLVSGVIALSTGRSLRQVWRTNTLWVFSYDVGASVLSLGIVALYLWFAGMGGLARLGFVVALLPLIVVKHAYSRLTTLQQLYDELDGAHEKLELNVREQLEMMVKSIEARDPYTSGHSRRVAALSNAIATDLGLDARTSDEIENAALLHDVGKIHAEFAPLLSKEGRLTEDEWEIMKTHAAKSAELVGLFSRFKGNVLESVRWHHERWDGKGYPDGIVAEKIPLGSRIIMISDTIDAMSTDRPYRKALSFEKVVSELLKYRGIQFDPGLVDVTINSVTVRRLVSDKEFLAQQTTSIKSSPRASSRPALRSQSSFWEGLRASSGQNNT
ncbi:MAG TPA: HD-GYP domain-containing protein [Gemmatimonadales bacterium]|jgi:HD-GYP domain-containing protein (c-di-GMP phosphodiesterase class II)|nr:HD-GYP domain-containing protein [Gemmatimonadales bacterium]